ncbi:hypothetical protein D0862_11135 [Hortaea werneckii]|uniref:Uncharacterized protein n=1 Tax=Hortaea werneckii TaxID=91943 RepID=A0A3M7F9Q8_HORWE|nr:hypothetical protein D0862_11135 [Hortaea werneckii]
MDYDKQGVSKSTSYFPYLLCIIAYLAKKRFFLLALSPNMPKPYGQRGRPHDVTTDERRIKHLHGTATAAGLGTEKVHATVSRWSIEHGIGIWPLGVEAVKRCSPTIPTPEELVKCWKKSTSTDCEKTGAMKIQCPGSNSQHWSYGAAYGVRNPVARPPGVAPPRDEYTPGSNNRLLRNQFIRDQVNIKWRGRQ